MRCPKCSNQQQNTVECRECGLIFEKYAKFQERKREREQQQIEVEKSSNSGRYLSTFLLVAVSVAATYYFTRPATENNPQSSNQIAQLTKDAGGEAAATNPAKLAPKKSTSMPAPVGATAIEQARRATVSIETPWGNGSGFFVDKNYVVTNKHVIEFKEEDLGEIQQKVETNRELIDLEEEKLKDLRKKMKRMPKGPGRRQLAIIIGDRKENLAKVLERQRKSEKKLTELEENIASPEINVILHDGSIHSAGYMVVSEEYDLALLALFSDDATYIKRPPEGRIFRQGDKVYTIGSPVGLRNTVTSGVFSGYRVRESDNQMFLQTDAAINPGNSGGPLIDENGYVHGVNTMILKNTEGIGFAIPIAKVFEEFGSTLQ
jgi:serine protease Do